MKRGCFAGLALLLLLSACIPETEDYTPLEKRETAQEIIEDVKQAEEEAREQVREQNELEKQAREEQEKKDAEARAAALPPPPGIEQVEVRQSKALGLYPYYFMEGDKFKANFITIIGDEAPSAYVVATSNLIARTPGSKPAGFSQLDSDIVDVTRYNAIVVGNPCNNRVLAKLFGNPFPCDSAPIPDGKGMLRLVEAANGNIALLAVGKTDAQVVAAVNAISGPGFGSVSASEICVQGASLMPC
jgi:hypothetical protein